MSCALARAIKLTPKSELSATSQALDQELSEATNPLRSSLDFELIGCDSAQEYGDTATKLENEKEKKRKTKESKKRRKEDEERME